MKNIYLVVLRVAEFFLVSLSIIVLSMFGAPNIVKGVFSSVPAQTASRIPTTEQQDIALPMVPIKEEASDNFVICKSDELALQYLSEKIDALSVIVANVKRPSSADVLRQEEVVKKAEVSAKKAVIKAPKKVVTETVAQQNNSFSSNFIGGGGGGSVTVTYPKILISEVTLGGIDDSTQEFVELYNPNETIVDLTHWYLQRKTKTGEGFGTFVPNTAFVGKTINAHGYFLIAREGSVFATTADIITDNPLTEDNALVLKNPNGEISDMVGFGGANEYEASPTKNPIEGQSIGRKFIENQLQDTDNNVNDFDDNNLTPRAQNTLYIIPEVIAEEVDEPEQLEEVVVVEENNTAEELVTVEEEPVQEIQESVVLQNIIINEIQTTGQTVKDEFIRLYNPNAVDVNLAGFSLKKKTSTGTESNLVSSASFIGTIPALGYFVIAPQDNDDGTKNYTGSIVPNLRYSGSSFSIANTNTIILYDDTGLMQNMQVAPLP